MAKRAPDAGTADDAAVGSGIRIADYPRAVRSIAKVRARGALAGFAVAAYFGHKIGLPFVDLVLRAILIGMATSLAFWAGAQAVWRQIVFAEIAVRRKEALARQQELIDAIDPDGHLD